MPSAPQKVQFQDLGTLAYGPAWALQEGLFQDSLSTKSTNRNKPENDRVRTTDHLLLVEHPHVYTLGKSGDMAHLLLNHHQLKEIDAEFFPIDRGGDITYHGPGQLVGYPILDLDHYFTDIHRYLRTLEEVILLTLADYGIEGTRSPGETGVWLDVGTPFARKICAMGVRASRWVTMHGWAFNVNTDLRYFEYIIPCGIRDKAVTSLQKELKKPVDIEEVKERVKKHFCAEFGVILV